MTLDDYIVEFAQLVFILFGLVALFGAADVALRVWDRLTSRNRFRR